MGTTTKTLRAICIAAAACLYGTFAASAATWHVDAANGNGSRGDTPEMKSITIRTFIDGDDYVKIRGNEVWFEHIYAVVPGHHEDGNGNEATFVNGVAWYPMWSNGTEGSIYSDEGVLSDKFVLPPGTPSLPLLNGVLVTLSQTSCRLPVTLVEQPSSANDYTATVKIEDWDDGAVWYEFSISWQEKGGVLTHSLAKGLVAYFPFDGDLLDAGDNEYHLSGNGKFTSDRFGNPQGAICFDGHDGQRLSNEDSNVWHSFSVSCWVKTDVSKDYSTYRVWAYGNYPLYPPCTESPGAGVGFKAGIDGITVVEHGPFYQPEMLTYEADIGNGWNHICMVVENDTTICIYLNGELVADGSLSNMEKRFNTLSVGGESWGCYTGSIDDLCVYDRALTDDEVMQLYLASFSYTGKTTYAITFDPNGGTGGSLSVTATYGSAMPRISVPTRTGYTFGGYYTAANGGGVQYYTAAGASARKWDKTAAITLFAKWTPTTYKVAYNANGGKLPKGTKMAAQTLAYGKAAKLRKNVFTRSGYVFAGWATSKANAKKGVIAYKNAQSVKNLRTDGKAVTLYAVWAKLKYMVAFYANGGKGATVVQTLKYGKAAKLTKCKFKAPKGKKFAGWATSAANAKAGKVKYKNAQAVKNLIITGKTVKLYAVWKKK